MLKIYLLLLFSILFNSLKSFAQSPRIDYFNVEKINADAALVKWRMTAGSTCLNLEVQRSKTNDTYTTVYAYPGVCGSSDSSILYDWIDANALPYQVSYYRIKLEEGEYSKTFRLDLDSELAQDEFIIYPNPASKYLQIKLRNEILRAYTVKIFSSKGETVFQQNYNVFTSLKILLPSLPQGIYYLQIESKDKKMAHQEAIIVAGIN